MRKTSWKPPLINSFTSKILTFTDNSELFSECGPSEKYFYIHSTSYLYFLKHAIPIFKDHTIPHKPVKMVVEGTSLGCLLITQDAGRGRKKRV